MIGDTNAQSVGGTVGTDTKPVKIVDGIAVAVTNDLISNTGNQSINGDLTVNKAIIDQLSIDVLSSSNNLYNTYDLDNAYADTRARLVLRVGGNGSCELYLEKYVLSTGVRTAQQSIIII